MDGKIFLYAAIAVGIVAILSALYVFIRDKQLPLSGMVVLLAGVILFGLPIWSSAEFSMDGEGFRFNFITINDRLESIETELQDNSAAVKQVKDDIVQVVDNVELVKAANLQSTALIARSFQNSTQGNPNIPSVYGSLSSQVLASRQLSIKEEADVAKLLKKTEISTRNLNKMVFSTTADGNGKKASGVVK